MELVYDYRTLKLIKARVMARSDGIHGVAVVDDLYVQCWRGYVGPNFMWIISD